MPLKHSQKKNQNPQFHKSTVTILTREKPDPHRLLSCLATHLGMTGPATGDPREAQSMGINIDGLHAGNWQETY
jgi:hypothetical protein